MSKSSSGAAATGAIVIIGYIFYMLFISYLMYAVYGQEVPLFELTDFSGPSWIQVVTGEWLVWVFEIIANYFILLAFTIVGDGIPEWLNIFFTVPFLFGIGWLILELIRG